MVAMTGLLLTLVLGVPVIRWLKKKDYRDQIYKEYCEKLELLHKNKAQVPTGGGILLFTVLIISILVWFPWTRPLTWLFILLITGYASLGWCDDRIKKKRQKGHGLKAKHKFIIQLCLATVTLLVLPYVYGSTKPLFMLKVPFVEGMVSVHSSLGKLCCLGLAFLAIVGTSNAVNLTDGLDGLAAGTLFITTLGFVIVALNSPAIPIAREIAYMFAALAGVCMGFLWYNGPPAQVFMGDTGSLLLGGMLGSCAVMLRAELILIIIGSIFVAEAGSVILQVVSHKCWKKRIFLCSPLHHHYEYQGMSEFKIVMRFWIVSLMCTGIGIAAALGRVL
nr:phospho-N-acetylmuramoyl-pentapeptide-transferase [Candidatus Chlamydia sanziniae]